MAELYCEDDCTKHTVELDKEEKKKISTFFADYHFDSVHYDELTGDILIILKDLEE